MAIILETKDYSRFVLQSFNRDVKKTWWLEASFRRDGFRDDEPISVTRLPDGRLQINEGHHRFYVARKLGIPVKYVEMIIAPLSPSQKAKTTKVWSLKDCLEGYVRMGKPAYICVRRYQEKTGIGLAACISMLAGDSAGSGNWTSQFKDGAYALGDPTHADIVGALVIHCRKIGCPFPATQLLVNALSKIAWAEGFDPEFLKNKLTLFPELLKKQSTKEDFIRVFELIYNRKSQTLLPLQVKAEEAARRRERGKEGRRKPSTAPKRPTA